MTRVRMKTCPTPGCPALIPRTDRRCPTCSKTHEQQRGTRQQRGYDRAHEKTRAELLPLAYGQPCPHCGVRMWPHDDLDLDHTDDRTGYVGIVHATCNRSRAGRQSHPKRT